METINILTAPEAYWIDAHESPPPIGSRVQCLTIGGVQVSAVWTSESIKYYDAWQRHIKMPESIKKRQLERYKL